MPCCWSDLLQPTFFLVCILFMVDIYSMRNRYRISSQSCWLWDIISPPDLGCREIILVFSTLKILYVYLHKFLLWLKPIFNEIPNWYILPFVSALGTVAYFWYGKAPDFYSFESNSLSREHICFQCLLRF